MSQRDRLRKSRAYSHRSIAQPAIVDGLLFWLEAPSKSRRPVAIWKQYRAYAGHSSGQDKNPREQETVQRRHAVEICDALNG
jgi:hypothetical protein